MNQEKDKQGTQPESTRFPYRTFNPIFAPYLDSRLKLPEGHPDRTAATIEMTSQEAVFAAREKMRIAHEAASIALEIKQQ